jgi:DNA-binding NarL/FixJ family response regulator
MCLRILLADDNDAVRFWVRLLLERNGFTVVGEAGDGREAIRLAQEFPSDIAILDISMPELSGLEAAQTLRSVSPATKVIIMSVHDHDSYILEALKSGARAYVSKNTARSDLLDAIRAVQRGSRYISSSLAGPAAETYRDGCDGARTPE